jgi:hypothetical protein
MGSRDFSKRETKKQKKDPKKIQTASVFEPVVEVQVVKKKGKKEEFPE